MPRSLVVALLGLALFALAPGGAHAQITWTGGPSGSWGVASNWSSGTVPAATDTVELDNGPGSDYTVRIDLNNQTVDTLAITSPNVTLEVASGFALSTNSGVLQQTGTVTGGGDLTVNGVLDWTGGRIEGTDPSSDQLFLGGGGDIPGDVTLDARRLVVPAGETLRWSDGSNGGVGLRGENGAIIEVQSGARFALPSNQPLSTGAGTIPRVINRGTLAKASGFGLSINWDVRNEDSVRVRSSDGGLQFRGTPIGAGGTEGVASGVYEATDSKLEFRVDSSMTFDADSRIRADSAATFDLESTVSQNTEVAVAGTLDVKGTLSSNNRGGDTTTVVVQSGATLQDLAGTALTLNRNGGVVVNTTAPLEIGALTLEVTGGSRFEPSSDVTVRGNARIRGTFTSGHDLTVEGEFTWDDGRIAGTDASTDTLRIDGGGEIPSDVTLDARRLLVPTGETLRYSDSGGFGSTGFTAENGAILEVQSGARFEITGGEPLNTGSGAAPRIVNRGVFAKPSGFQNRINWDVRNEDSVRIRSSDGGLQFRGTPIGAGGTEGVASGVYEATDSKLEFRVDSSMTFDADSRIRADSAATFDLESTVSQNTEVAVAGTLDVKGTLSSNNRGGDTTTVVVQSGATLQDLAGTAVTLNRNGGVAVNTAEPIQIGALTIGSVGGRFILSSDVTIRGDATLNNGPVVSDSDLTVQGALNWSRGRIAGTDAATDTLRVNGGGDISGNVTLDGRRLLVPTGETLRYSLAATAGSGLVGANGAILDIQSGAQFEDTGFSNLSAGAGDPPRVLNRGTVIKTADSGTQLNWALQNVGTVVVDVAGSVLKLRGRLLDGAGTSGRTEGTYRAVTGRLKVNPVADTLRVRPGARFLAESGGTIEANTNLVGPGVFEVRGELFAEFPIRAEGGQVRLRSNGQIRRGTPGNVASNPDTVLTVGSGTLDGTGTLTGDVGVDGGTVRPGTDTTAGTLTVDGAYRQSAGTRLNADLGGTAPGADYDSLSATSVTLAGELRLEQRNDFVPTPADTLRPVTWSSGDRTGTFDQITGTEAVGTSLRTLYDNAALKLAAKPPPTVAAEPATAVGDSSATLQAQVDPNADTTTVTFDYGLDPSYGHTASGSESPLRGTTAQPDSAQVTGLLPGTTYHYRVRVSNDAGADTTADQTVTTAPSRPVATTDSASAVSDTSATLYGAVNAGGDPTTVSFRLFPAGRPSAADTALAAESPVDSTTTAVVTLALDTLRAGTDYTFEVLAQNGVGATSGRERTFTTAANRPAVTIAPATAVTDSSATLNGSLDPGGAVTRLYAQLQSSRATRIVPIDTVRTGLTASTPIAYPTSPILRPGTQYDYRLLAANRADSVSSPARSFTTAPAAPVARVQPPSAIGRTQATLEGTVNPAGAVTRAYVQFRRAGAPDSVVVPVDTLQTALTTDRAVGIVTADTLAPSTTYAYRIVAANAVDSVRSPAEQVFTTAADPPAPPSGLQATAGVGRITLDWQPNPESDLHRYRLYRDTAPIDSAAGPAGRTPLDSTAAGTTTFIDSSATAGTTYYYRITAVTTDPVEGGFSAPVVDTARTAPVPAVQPAALRDTLSLDGARTRTLQVENAATAATAADLTFTIPTGEVPDWGALSPASGVVAPGRAQSVAVTLDASGTPPGLYRDTLAVIAPAAGPDTARVPVTLAVDPPAITLDGPDAPVAPGTDVPVDVTIPASFTPQSATLRYRPAGAASFRDTALAVAGLAPGTAGTVSASIPGEAVTERGVQFYVRASGPVPGGTEPIQVTVPATAPGAPAFLPVRIDRVQARGAFPEDRYRMLTVPVGLDDRSVFDVLTEQYGPYDPSQWTWARWAPADSSYRRGPAVDSLRPGQAAWLATEDGVPLTVREARSSAADGPQPISLVPGWNQIGNPFAFPVPWTAVDRPPPVRPPVGYDATRPQGRRFRFGIDTLRAWRGAFVYNAADTAVTVEVPPTGAAPPSSAPTAAAPAPGGGYQIRMVARRAAGGQSRRSGPVRLETALGGRSGFGPKDRVQPPPLGTALRLSVQPPEGPPLARSVKPPTAASEPAGRMWAVRLAVPEGGGTEGPVQLQITDQRQPAGTHLYVVDQDRGRRLPVTHETASVPVSGSRPVRRLRVLLGTRAFAEAHSGGVDLTIQETKLRANAPNPFADATTIPYQLAEERDVRIRVYDVLGRRVATLVDGRREAGLHHLTWRPERGRSALASGVYFCRMRAGDYRATRKLVVVR
jgi:hypothetical protein